MGYRVNILLNTIPTNIPNGYVHMKGDERWAKCVIVHVMITCSKKCFEVSLRHPLPQPVRSHLQLFKPIEQCQSRDIRMSTFLSIHSLPSFESTYCEVLTRGHQHDFRFSTYCSPYLFSLSLSQIDATC